MASVRPREWAHNGKTKRAFVVSYTDQGGKRRLKTFPKAKQAEAYRLKVETEIEAGVHIAPAESGTVHEAAAAWLADCDRRSLIGDHMTKQTAYAYHSMVSNHVLPRWATVKVCDLDPLRITEWLQVLRTKYAIRTVSSIHKCLSLILDHAVRTRKARRNIMLDHKVKPPGGERPRPRIPSLAEARHLLQTLAQRGYREKGLPHINRQAVVPIALFCGLRKGEISALKWENVRFDLGIIHVRHSFNYKDGLKSPKTEAGQRDVVMNPLVLDALLALHAYHGRPASGFVFMSEAGHVIGPQHIWSDLWDPLMKRAGFKDEAGKNRFTFHALRHACVSLLIADGLDALHVKNFIGHRTVSTTLNVYGHLFPEDTRVKTSIDSVARLFDATRARQGLLTN